MGSVVVTPPFRIRMPDDLYLVKPTVTHDPSSSAYRGQPRGRTVAVIHGSTVTVAETVLSARENEFVSAPKRSIILSLKIRPKRWRNFGGWRERTKIGRRRSNRTKGNPCLIYVYYALPHILGCPDSTEGVWVKKHLIVFTRRHFFYFPTDSTPSPSETAFISSHQ